MPKPSLLASSLVLAMLLAAASGPVFNVAAAPLGATSPTLGAAASYSVLAGSIATNTGATTMPGDLGISPSIGVPPHYTGFPPGVVGPPGTIHDADANAAAAQAADTAAFTALDQGCDTTYAGVQDLTLVSPLGPGVYCAGAFLLTGNLTLSGSGVWIFKSAATLTTSSNSSVTGGDPCNVWWRLVSSGTLATGTNLIGNILALTSITLQTGASLNGRALAQTGQVTLDTNTIIGPTCAQAPTPAATVGPLPSFVDVSYPCSLDSTQVVVTVGMSAGVIVYGLGDPITSPVDTGANKIVRVLPFGHYDWHAVPPAGHYMQNASSGVVDPFLCGSATPPAGTPNATLAVAPTQPTTATAAPTVIGLPATGGGPLPGGEFPWSQALVLGGLGAVALGLGVGAYRRRARPPSR